MGVLTDLLGRLPRLQVLEVFAENPDYAFSAPEIERAAQVARRTAYIHLPALVEEGILVIDKEGGLADPLRYRLNPADIRALYLPLLENVVASGKLEAELRADLTLEPSDPLPGILRPSAVPGRAASATSRPGRQASRAHRSRARRKGARRTGRDRTSSK